MRTRCRLACVLVLVGASLVRPSPEQEDTECTGGGAWSAAGARTASRRAIAARPPDVRRAVACARAGRALDPADGWWDFVEGSALEMTGERRKAASLYARALGRAGGDAWRVRFALANLLATSGYAPEAIQHYAAALRQEPRSALTFLNAGNTLLMAGNRSHDAMRAYAAALRLLPSLHGAACGLKDALASEEMGTSTASDALGLRGLLRGGLNCNFGAGGEGDLNAVHIRTRDVEKSGACTDNAHGDAMGADMHPSAPADVPTWEQVLTAAARYHRAGAASDAPRACNCSWDEYDDRGVWGQRETGQARAGAGSEGPFAGVASRLRFLYDSFKFEETVALASCCLASIPALHRSAEVGLWAPDDAEVGDCASGKARGWCARVPPLPMLCILVSSLAHLQVRKRRRGRPPARVQ